MMPFYCKSEDIKKYTFAKLAKAQKFHKNALRKRIVTAAKFFGCLYINELISEDNFGHTFDNLRDGSEDPHKFEALCHLLLIVGQFVTEYETHNGSQRYVLEIEPELNIDSRRGIGFLNTAIENMKE